MALQNEYHDEYEALTEEGKQELVDEFEVHKEEGMKIHCPTAHAHIQDIANVARNIQLLVSRTRHHTFPACLHFGLDDGFDISCQN
jgi:hypothetical protein